MHSVKWLAFFCCLFCQFDKHILSTMLEYSTAKRSHTEWESERKEKEHSNLSFRPLYFCQLSKMKTRGCKLRMFNKWVKTSSW